MYLLLTFNLSFHFLFFFSFGFCCCGAHGHVYSCLHLAPEKLGAEGEEEVQGVREREGEGGGEEGGRGKHLCVCGTLASFFRVCVSFVFSYADDFCISLSFHCLLP